MIACERCLTDCIENSRSECAELCRECADICALTARMNARNSTFGPDISALCAMVCSACADECAKHAMHHEACKQCAAACRQCVGTCQVVAEELI
ncbi:MAG: four-helix bundle copper-binding protein [Flavobacteriales bacterium]